ncbi:MAG TPA: hypothetical protein VFB78_02335 [Acidimicrobiales bacterium]|nr:hypothetical protein [Acidimicrobiales bacterium]
MEILVEAGVTDEARNTAIAIYQDAQHGALQAGVTVVTGLNATGRAIALKVNQPSTTTRVRSLSPSAAVGPLAATILVSERGRCLGVSYNTGSVRRVVQGGRAEAVAELTRFFVEVATPARERPIGGNATEELIRRLYILLDEREALIALLMEVFKQRRVAEERVRVLEGLLMALQAENDLASKHRSNRTLGGLALVVATVLGPVAAVAVDHALSQPAVQVVAQSVKVQVECGMPPASAPPKTE